MSVFLTPTWETNAIGDKNACQLFKTGVKSRISKKIKRNNRKQQTKINNRSNNTSSVPISNTNDKTQDHFKTKAQKKISHNIVKKKESPSKRFNAVGNKSKLNINGENVLNKNKFQPTSKSTETVIKRIDKRKLKSLKQRNKILDENRTIFTADKQGNSQLSNKTLLKTDCTKDKNKNMVLSKAEIRRQKLINLLNTTPGTESKRSKTLSLRERMIEKLKASRFRYINEQIYNSGSKEIRQYFEKDPEAFQAYHDGYRQQVSKWPINPVDIIIKSVKKMSRDYIIADLGCGDAKLAKSVPQKVHSFDLVAANDQVVACDMSKIPLENESVDVVVFCLSLMGNNIKEYLFEANRILKNGGILKIAEVESRFDSLDNFLEGVKRFGFVNARKDSSYDLFYFLDFKKTFHCKSLHKLPTISLHPCLYKKR